MIFVKLHLSEIQVKFKEASILIYYQLNQYFNLLSVKH